MLFTGDTVGREDGSPADSIIAAEEAMVEGEVELRSDVLVAPHHGADNGSSLPFIEAIDPTFVVFSAGHDHEHPRASTAERFLDHGLSIENMLRTDRGDSEGGDEWSVGSTGEEDPRGDDDVDVLIRPNGEFFVAYRDDTMPIPSPGPPPVPFALSADDLPPRAQPGVGRLSVAPDGFRIRAPQAQADTPTTVIHIQNLTIENLTIAR